jgi:hypothetical protein
MADRRTSIYEVGLLAGLVTVLTAAAAWIYPIWDDGRLLLAIQESGSRAIWINFGNRPLAALYYVFLLNYHLFLPISIVLHWATWLGLGLVTIRFWRVMFPAHSGVALLPALLSVAPILTKVQLAILTIPSIVLVGPLLGYVAIFMLLSEQSTRPRKILVSAAGLALIAFSILISEYAVVTAIVGLILLSATAIRDRSERKRERWVIAASIAACMFISYSVYLWLGKGTGRDAFRPGYILEVPGWRIRGIPFRLLSGIWRGEIGGLLESLGSITLNSKAAVLSFVCGAIVSGLVVLFIHKREAFEFSLQQDKFSIITLLVAVFVALIPVVLMDRTLEVKWDSRFFLPVMPVLASLSVYILFYVLKARLYLLVPVICGFLAGYWTSFEIARTFRNPDPVVALPRKSSPKSPIALEWMRETNRRSKAYRETV